MERGELQGIGDWSWSSMKTARPDWLRDKKITLLMQAALHEEPELAGLPSALDFVKNDADRKVIRRPWRGRSSRRQAPRPSDWRR
jgi:hypothetical protein